MMPRQDGVSILLYAPPVHLSGMALGGGCPSM